MVEFGINRPEWNKLHSSFKLSKPSSSDGTGLSEMMGHSTMIRVQTYDSKFLLVPSDTTARACPIVSSYNYHL